MREANPPRAVIANRPWSNGLILWAALFFCLPTYASGHARLVSSDPSGNAILEQPPKILRLWYDEDLVAGLSVASILDRSNFVVVQGGALTDLDRKVLVLPVASLKPGLYTVSWKVLSAVDGHITRGAFAFIFLPPGTDPAVLLERGSAYATQQAGGRSLLVAVQALAGWIHLTGLFLGLGGLHFTLVILGIGRRANGEISAIRESLLGPTMVLAAKAWMAALIAGILWWEINTHLTSDTTLAHFLFRPVILPYLWGARVNQSMILRLCLLLLALVVLHWVRRASSPSLVLLGYCEAVVAAALLALALSSHSAASWPSPLSVVIDTFHLWAGALWVGGLIVLAVMIPRLLGKTQASGKAQVVLRAMQLFTPWAIGSVVLLTLTGLSQVLLHIPKAQAMVQTYYGWALGLKLLLVLPMLFLGGFNGLIARVGVERDARQTSWLNRRLQGLAVGFQAWGHRWLPIPQWTVRGELILGVMVLLCVAVLTQLPPPKVASTVPLPTTLHARADGLMADLTVASSEGLLGQSDLTVRLRQSDGRGVDGITRVSVRPTGPGGQMNISPIPATPLSGGEYRAQMLLSMLGRWEFAVVVRRKGVEEDAVFRFPYVLLDVGSGQTEVGPALPERLSVRAAWSTPSTRWKFWGAAALIVVGFAVTSVVGGKALAWHRRAVLLFFVGIPFLLFGGHQLIETMVVDTTPTAWRENPVPSDAASLARGRTLYLANCTTCHGESGRGTSPVRPLQSSRFLRSVDLTADHMEAHSEGDLFWWISKGIPGSAMPSFEDSLTPEERWDLVNYIRSLRRAELVRP